MSKLFKHQIDILGCGRTDTGVHASDYYFHADLETDDLDLQDLKYKLNRMMPSDISVMRILEVADEAHARFDATSRSYDYVLIFEKDPFLEEFSYKYDQSGELDFNKMNEAAELLLEFGDFYPFCKSNTDVNNYKCKMIRSEWRQKDANCWIYTVEANRFLRGMVRLIVGMCINYASGKIELDEVRKALEDQTRLENAWSVPAKGLSLVKINYPYIDPELA